MFLAALPHQRGHTPTRIPHHAKVHLGEGPTISLIELETEAEVPNLDEAAFLQHAETRRRIAGLEGACRAGDQAESEAREISRDGLHNQWSPKETHPVHTRSGKGLWAALL